MKQVFWQALQVRRPTLPQLWGNGVSWESRQHPRMPEYGPFVTIASELLQCTTDLDVFWSSYEVSFTDHEGLARHDIECGFTADALEFTVPGCKNGVQTPFSASVVSPPRICMRVWMGFCTVMPRC